MHCCTGLTDVYYSDTEAGWRNISISYTDYRNELLRDANIHYNSTGHAPSTSNDISVTVSGRAVTWTDAAPFIDANSRTMVPLRAVADAMAMMGFGHNKAVRHFKELESIGLIERKKQGQGKPTRIYVKNFILPPEPGQTPTPETSLQGWR